LGKTWREEKESLDKKKRGKKGRFAAIRKKKCFNLALPEGGGAKHPTWGGSGLKKGEGRGREKQNVSASNVSLRIMGEKKIG